MDRTPHSLPNATGTQDLITGMLEGELHRLLAQLTETAIFQGAINIHTMDELRVEYADGYGLMRASNATLIVALRFEADSKPALSHIKRNSVTSLVEQCQRSISL